MNYLKWVGHFLFDLFVVCVVGLTSAQAFEECIKYFDQVEVSIKDRKSLAESGVLTLKDHRKMFYTKFNVSDPNQPVLVLFPGFYIQKDQNSEFILLLESMNIPYINFSFSTQPHSIATLNPAQDLPSFKNLTTKDLAEEVITLIQYLGLKKPVPVALSYSSSLIEHFPEDLFPFVIDSVPITILNEGHEITAALYNMVSLFSSFNIFSKWMEASIRQQNLYNYWNKHVGLRANELKALRTGKLNILATEGYIAMFKAVEEYDMRTVDFSKGPKRIFILAGDEAPIGLKYQKQAITNAEEQLGYKMPVYTIEGADHFIFNSKPIEYMNILLEILADYESLVGRESPQTL